jgi:uncharacterized protein (TIGR00730 family)
VCGKATMVPSAGQQRARTVGSAKRPSSGPAESAKVVKTLVPGGEAVGVIPEHLMEREVGHKGLTKLHVVRSMHERKALMADLSDAFIAMPGGFGTFEEFCEVVTWAQLGLHAKPCGIVNVLGYYSPLLAMFDHAVEERFLKPENRGLVLARDSVVGLLQALAEWRPVRVEKWLDRDTR